MDLQDLYVKINEAQLLHTKGLIVLRELMREVQEAQERQAASISEPQHAEPDQMKIDEKPLDFETRIAPDVARLEDWIIKQIAGWKWSIPHNIGGRVGRSAILEYSKAAKWIGDGKSWTYIKTLREQGNWDRVEWYDAPALAGYPGTRKDGRAVPYVRVWF